MSGAPEIMMPLTTSAAAEQMMIEEMRRFRETLDRFTGVVASLDKNVALMAAEQSSITRRVSANETTLQKHGEKIDKLEGWRDRRDGASGLAGWFFNTPILGWLAAAAAVLWSALGTHKP